MSIDFSKLINAYQIFEDFRIDMQTDRDKAGAIQAFEFCYELAWKMMKRALLSRGLETGSPKDVFRKAAIDNLIDDPEIWFFFLEQRNLSSHVYERKNMEIILQSFSQFSIETKKLIDNLKRIT